MKIFDSSLYAAIPIAESSGSIENTVIGAVIIGVAIAVSKVLDAWWSNRRADAKQEKDEVRADKEQVFRIQEQLITDLLGRIQLLEKDSKDKDGRINQLQLQHDKCERDHAECKGMIEGLKAEISALRGQVPMAEN